MVNKSPSINLVKNKTNFWEQFFTWTLSVGRVVIVLTEGIALAAFLYRFGLDAQLIDLRGTIKQQQRIVDSLRRNEDTYRNLQLRLAQISKLETQATDTTKIFSDIVALAPADLIFNKLTVGDNQIRIDANLQSVTSLSSFVQDLRNYEGVRSVSVDKIENKTSRNTITVLISATLLKKPYSL